MINKFGSQQSFPLNWNFKTFGASGCLSFLGILDLGTLVENNLLEFAFSAFFLSLKVLIFYTSDVFDNCRDFEFHYPLA